MVVHAECWQNHKTRNKTWWVRHKRSVKRWMIMQERNKDTRWELVSDCVIKVRKHITRILSEQWKPLSCNNGKVKFRPPTEGNRLDVPITILGRSNRSLRIEKQNVDGTGAPFGFNSTQCEYTDCVVFSKAWEAKFSQYSTTDWFSNSCAGRAPILEHGVDDGHET